MGCSILAGLLANKDIGYIRRLCVFDEGVPFLLRPVVECEAPAFSIEVCRGCCLLMLSVCDLGRDKCVRKLSLFENSSVRKLCQAI